MKQGKIEYNEDKNLLLKETRGVDFSDIIEALRKGNFLDDLKHSHSKKYPKQRILVVKIKNYAYAVPYVLDQKKNSIFLKTLYPSRVLTRKYLRKETKS